MLSDVLEDAGNQMNTLARLVMRRAQSQWRDIDAHIAWCDERIAAHVRDNSVVMTVHKRSDPVSKWAAALRDRAVWQKAAVALANKNERILWAVMTKGEAFDARHVSVKPGGATPMPATTAA